MHNKYPPNSFYGTCDRCGGKFRQTNLMFCPTAPDMPSDDGLRVCKKCWDPIHPQLSAPLTKEWHVDLPDPKIIRTGGMESNIQAATTSAYSKYPNLTY